MSHTLGVDEEPGVHVIKGGDHDIRGSPECTVVDVLRLRSKPCGTGNGMHPWIHSLDLLRSDYCFTHTHMLTSKEQLPVQITALDAVHICH